MNESENEDEIILTEEDEEEKKKHFSNENLSIIRKYLMNPTSTGIWISDSLENKGKDNISNYLINQLNENFLKIKETSNKKIKRMKITDENLKQIKNEVNKMTFYFEIFYYLTTEEKYGKNDIRTYQAGKKINNTLFSLLIFEDIKKKYKAGFDYFEERLYTEKMNTTFHRNEIYFFKERYLILKESPSINKRIKFCTLNHDYIDYFLDFWKKINFIEKPEEYMIFSPEEEVFYPYMNLLKFSYNDIIKEKTFKNGIGKAIEEYNNKKYSYSINSIGILEEDLLGQIYETLYRENLPKGFSTLGKSIDIIQHRAKEILNLFDVKEDAELQKMFDEINNLIDNKKNYSNDDLIIKNLELLRKAINFNKEQIRSLKYDQPKSKRNIKLIFPDFIIDNLDELIKYRNTISHRSRTPIRSYESERCMYNFITSLFWWNEKKNKIDWKKNREEILQDFIKENRI
jgi:hypothetical protein